MLEIMCEECYGKGQIEITFNPYLSDDEKYIECPTCKGLGKVEFIDDGKRRELC